MPQLSDAELLEYQRVLKLLDQQTPTDVPDRQQLIERAAQGWLSETRRVRRLVKKRR